MNPILLISNPLFIFLRLTLADDVDNIKDYHF
jgi:hypothetical protein